MSAPALSDALRRIAAAPRLLVAVDFDGTLAPIVERPGDARPVAGAVEALVELVELPGTEVAVVSGRTAASLLDLLGPSASSLHLVGSHGAEIDGEVRGLDDAARRDRDALVEAVEALVGHVPGVLLEPKPAGIAVHVRMAERQAAEQVVETLMHGPAADQDVHVLHGSEVLELSVLETSKGAAVDLLRERAQVSAVLFAGDDVTDETALARLRDGDVGIKVGPGETAAPYRVAAPEDVRDLLATLAVARREAGGRRAVSG